MKEKRYLLWLFAVCFAALAFAFASASAMAADEEEDAFGNIMNTGYAKIGDVTFTAPAAGAPCAVTAKITLEGVEDFDNLKVKSAKLTYVLNGDRKTAQSVDMTGAGDSYTASIPGQPAGTKVAFYITVVDTLGNTSTEALPVDKVENAPSQLVAGVPDMDNSQDIVADSADLLGSYVGYDKDYIYAGYDLQGDMTGGTLDPPYIQLYGIKFSNPDVETGEGLMVGKLWIDLPLAVDKTVQDQFLPKLLSQAKEYMDKIPKEQIDRVMNTGMLVLDIGKLVAGQWMEGLLFSAEPTQIKSDNKKQFVGYLKRSTLGDNPSGFFRVIEITAANASIDSFMPIPLNCSHFIQIYTRDHEYDVK